MKLSDFSLLDETEQDDLAALVAGFNDTARPYPRDKTVHQLFREQAAKTPAATAVLFNDEQLTYAQLDGLSNRFAHFLLETGLVQRETFVAVMMQRRLELIPILLGILKAGGAYVPLDPALPHERLKLMLNDTRAPVLVGEKQAIRTLNKLQWECPHLAAIVCVDSNDIYNEIEAETGMMDREMWDYIAQMAVDDISGGGWKSSYTGEWLSREVMDEYGHNIRAKLAPHLTPDSRILEIGCASGISMFRLAPLAGYYLGTDLSAGIITWAEREAAQRGLDNVHLQCLPAHEIERLDEANFDVAIINSVIECFPGHNYLRRVLRQTIDKMAGEGWLFLGNVWDQDHKEEFIASLRVYKQAHPNARTKLEREDELYISRRFLEDLRHDFPEITEISYSEMLGETESELSLFGYDALLRIEKYPSDLRKSNGPGQRYKWQYDRRDWLNGAETAVPEQTGATGLAYLIYTSGSTGRPKGVMVEHRPILRLVLNTNYIELNEQTRILQTGSLAFDASTFEIWGALLNGGVICLPGGKALLDGTLLAQLIGRHQVNTIFLTTGLFNQIVENDVMVLAGLKTILSGGEKVSVSHFNRLRAALPHINLLHVYGPTENTTFSTYFPVRRQYEWDVPIGYPIANSTAYILDENGRAVPIGTPGHLHVGGDGLARGYWKDEGRRMKDEKSPFILHPSAFRLYRTGDLARWLPDGAIEFLGRIDNQVKIRGYRIEPDEVTVHLRQHEAIREAVVVVGEGQGDKQLVAYFTADVPLTEDTLRAHLKTTLPDYMIPVYFVALPQMPLNQSGKIDRRALPDPTAVSHDNNYIPPQTETERLLATIWAEVLARPRLSLLDNFFDVGGHSLKVTNLIALIEQRLGVVMPLTVVFTHPTIRRQADYLLDCAQYGQAIADEPMVLLNGEQNDRPLFAFPPGTGDALGYVQLATALKPLPFYAFNFLEAETRLQTYADLIMATDPEGPYRLLGYSSGGNLAYYVAHELEARGKQVSQIIMVDSGRRLVPYPMPPAEVEAAIAAFMSHESIRPYLTSPILMEKQARLIRRSFAWIGQMVDNHIIAADMHLLTSAGEEDVVYDKNGRLVSSMAGWADVVGRLYIYQGSGHHNEMLYPPNLAPNVAIMQDILDAATQ